MIKFEYREPRTVDEALSLLAEHGEDAKILAGGTGLLIMMKQRLVRPAVLVSIRRIAELNYIREEADNILIGTLCTHADAEYSGLLKSKQPSLAETFHHVATPRIRNMGTVGGNLSHADPAEDPPSTLLALNASVKLASQGGERIVPLQEFFTDYYETAIQPGEILTQIIVPNLPQGAGTGYHKFLPRSADDYATVGISCVLQVGKDGKISDVRIGMNAVGPTPMRATRAEGMLTGQKLTDELLRAAAEAAGEDVDPIGDIRGSSEYKRDMVKVWVRRVVNQAAASAVPI